MRNNFKTYKLQSVQRDYFSGQRRRLLRFRIPSIRREGHLYVRKIFLVSVAQSVPLFEEVVKLSLCHPLLELRLAA